MTQFTITLQHDAGKISIRTWAENAAQAANQVLKYECAPVSAILSIEEKDS